MELAERFPVGQPICQACHIVSSNFLIQADINELIEALVESFRYTLAFF